MVRKTSEFNMNTIREIQVSNSVQSIDTEDNENDFFGWRSLPDMVTTSKDSDSSCTDGTEWLDDSFYEQNYTISNLEHAKLKVSHFAVKLLSIEPITPLFDTWATCSCIFQQNFMKI